MKNFRNLEVWKLSHSFTLKIYKVTDTFPSNQKYSLVQQLQRASVSIEANIAEGCFRSSDPDFLRFLFIAGGSASEVDCLIEIAKDLKFISQDQYTELNSEITSILKMISKFMNKIKSDLNSK